MLTETRISIQPIEPINYLSLVEPQEHDLSSHVIQACDFLSWPVATQALRPVWARFGRRGNLPSRWRIHAVLLSVPLPKLVAPS